MDWMKILRFLIETPREHMARSEGEKMYQGTRSLFENRGQRRVWDREREDRGQRFQDILSGMAGGGPSPAAMGEVGQMQGQTGDVLSMADAMPPGEGSNLLRQIMMKRMFPETPEMPESIQTAQALHANPDLVPYMGRDYQPEAPPSDVQTSQYLNAPENAGLQYMPKRFRPETPEAPDDKWQRQYEYMMGLPEGERPGFLQLLGKGPKGGAKGGAGAQKIEQQRRDDINALDTSMYNFNRLGKLAENPDLDKIYGTQYGFATAKEIFNRTLG